ncbi:MAG TPA: 6-phosphogluconolactonase [Thermoanaerobaculia bacterium]|nr:6-phosphogluconolactonase [Thermoanaerobaculia bacterium]
MNLRIFDSPGDLARATARAILQRTAHGGPSVIGISGGSTPRPLYELLGGEHRPALAERSITWVLVDERYVPLDDPQSNSAMIRSTLFRDGIPPGHRLLDFDTTHDDASESVLEFEERWRALGLSTLDAAILGVGEDGHTASLFPGTPVLDVQDRIAAAVYVPRLEQWRVTLTMPVIRSAALRLVMVAGESKAAIVRDVAAAVDHPVARATTSPAGETWWLVDRAAASITTAPG